MRPLASLSLASLYAGVVLAQQSVYQQCGGIGWSVHSYELEIMIAQVLVGVEARLVFLKLRAQF